MPIKTVYAVPFNTVIPADCRANNVAGKLIRHTSAADKMLQSLHDSDQSKWRRYRTSSDDSNQITSAVRKTQVNQIGQALHNVRTFCDQQIQHVHTLNSQPTIGDDTLGLFGIAYTCVKDIYAIGKC